MDGNDMSLAAWKRVAETLPQELHGCAREWAQAIEGLERGQVSLDTEWLLWRSLCEALVESGAVTEADLKARRSEQDTPGRRLLRALVAWGRARMAIATAEAEGEG